MACFHKAIGRSPRSNRNSETVTKSTQPCWAQAGTSQPSCGAGLSRASAESGHSSGERHAHGQHQPAISLSADIIEHLPNPLDQRIHLGDAFRRRAALEEIWESIEVELDAVAIVAPNGFLDQPKRVFAHFVVGEVHRSFASILFGTQSPFGVIHQELRAEKVVAVIVVDPKREQRLETASLCLSEHDRVRIDPFSKNACRFWKACCVSDAGHFASALRASTECRASCRPSSGST